MRAYDMKKGKSKEKLERLLADFTENLIGEVDRSMELNPEELDSLSVGTDGSPSLSRTVRIISSVIQPKQPSEEFSARLLQATQERFQERMIAEKMQRIIAMAVTDGEFRTSFFQDVVTACRNAGFDLTPQEAAALRNLKEDDVEKFANSLDERITKFFPTSLP